MGIITTGNSKVKPGTDQQTLGSYRSGCLNRKNADGLYQSHMAI